jgi:hypothetical protein
MKRRLPGTSTWQNALLLDNIVELCYYAPAIQEHHSMTTIQNKLRAAADWQDKLNSLLDEADAELDLRLVRPMLRAARDRVNVAIASRAKSKRKG